MGDARPADAQRLRPHRDDRERDRRRVRARSDRHHRQAARGLRPRDPRPARRPRRPRRGRGALHRRARRRARLPEPARAHRPTLHDARRRRLERAATRVPDRGPRARGRGRGAAVSRANRQSGEGPGLSRRALGDRSGAVLARRDPGGRSHGVRAGRDERPRCVRVAPRSGASRRSRLGAGPARVAAAGLHGAGVSRRPAGVSDAPERQGRPASLPAPRGAARPLGPRDARGPRRPRGGPRARLRARPEKREHLDRRRLLPHARWLFAARGQAGLAAARRVRLHGGDPRRLRAPDRRGARGSPEGARRGSAAIGPGEDERRAAHPEPPGVRAPAARDPGRVLGAARRGALRRVRRDGAPVSRVVSPVQGVARGDALAPGLRRRVAPRVGRGVARPPRAEHRREVDRHRPLQAGRLSPVGLVLPPLVGGAAVPAHRVSGPRRRDTALAALLPVDGRARRQVLHDRHDPVLDVRPRLDRRRDEPRRRDPAARLPRRGRMPHRRLDRHREPVLRRHPLGARREREDGRRLPPRRHVSLARRRVHVAGRIEAGLACRRRGGGGAGARRACPAERAPHAKAGAVRARAPRRALWGGPRARADGRAGGRDRVGRGVGGRRARDAGLAPVRGHRHDGHVLLLGGAPQAPDPLSRAAGRLCHRERVLRAKVGR